MEKEIVVFRKYKEGDIIALFPEYYNGYNNRLYNRDLVMSYMHIGQHSEASYSGVVATTVPAIQAEYNDLLQELISIGYELEVRKRRPNTRR